MALSLRLIRLAFGALQRTAPPLAAAWADRIFCTPPRRGMSERMAQWLAAGQRFDVPADRRRVVVWSWGEGDGKPIVVLIHGWGSRAARFVGLGEALVESGHRVVALDGPGHGESPGRLSSGIEFARAILAVANAVGGVHGIVGHSLGGFATVLALRQGLAVRRAVFISPSATIDAYADRFATVLGVTPRVMTAMRRRLERRLRFGWDQLDAAAIAPTMRIPLLVIHDRDDAEVSWDEGAAIARAWPDATLVTTTGLGHHRIASDGGVVGRVVQFLQRPD